jgi:hypothetical protein
MDADQEWHPGWPQRPPPPLQMPLVDPEEVACMIPKGVKPYDLPLCYCCKFCMDPIPRKLTYRVVNGPVETHFCGEEHALLWMQHRHKPILNQLFKLDNYERRVVFLEKNRRWKANLPCSIHAIIENQRVVKVSKEVA